MKQGVAYVGYVTALVALFIATLTWIAYLFSVHVPAIVDDPSNMASWAWVVVGAMLTLSGGVGGGALRK